MSSRRGTSRWEDKKRRTRDTIEAAAWRLFIRDGFDATTVDEIAEASGVATRTFFRYFETKEAVLYGAWRERLAELCDRLRDRPADEPPLVAIVNTLAGFVEELEDETSELLQRARVAARSERFGRYRHEVVEPTSVEAIAAVIAARLGVDVDRDVRPRLFAGVANVALNAARDAWLANGGREPLSSMLQRTFAELGVPLRSRPRG
ncbi:MAG TPA: TetR family transcriptional regulator [Acidimicrobiales bacterium]